MSNKVTQVSQLINYLQNNETISQLEARHVFGVERLSSRMWDIKQQGFDIQAKRCTDCMGKRYTRYSLVQEEWV